MNQPGGESHVAGMTRLMTLLTYVIVTAVLYLAKDILIPIALAVLISFLLSPIVMWLEKRGIKRAIAVVALVLVVMGAMVGLGFLLVGQFVEFVDNLPQYRNNIVQKVQAVKPTKEGVFGRAEAALVDISREMNDEGTSVTEVGTTDATEREVSTTTTLTMSDATLEAPERGVPVRVVEGPPNSWETFQGMVTPVVSVLGVGALVMLFVVFFLLQREDLRDRVIRLAGKNQVRLTTQALEESAVRVSRYLLMQLVINVTYGIPVAIGLWCIGVPNALLWGAMATILRFIPYVGPWIAALMPVMLSLAVFDNWTMPLLVIGLFVVLEVISNNVMEPILYGQSTGVSPVAIIVSAMFWTWLWGGVGLVLATPITVCLVVLGRHIPQLSVLHVLLGDDPVLSDDARVYNRLLSGATDEAVAISEDYLEDHGVADLFDEVLLPALENAENDRMEGLLTTSLYEKFIVGMLQVVDAAEDELQEQKEEEGDKALTGSKTPAPAGLKQRSILCVPVKDAADEVAALMLQILLEDRGARVKVLKHGQLASEVMKELSSETYDSVVISSVPPFSYTPVRYLAKKISREYPDLRLTVGMWRRPNDESEDSERFDERLHNLGVEQFYTTLSEAWRRV